jgi:hypothetical protein
MDYFPTGIKDIDTSIILQAPISVMINLYLTSTYLRDILDDAQTFVMFKEMYPYSILECFNDCLILNNELKKNHSGSRIVTKHLNIGDRVLYNNQNYKVINYKLFRNNPRGSIIECDLLGKPLSNSTLDIGYNGSYGFWMVIPGSYILSGILKHRNGPIIDSIDSKYLLYDSYVRPIFGGPDDLYPGLLVSLTNQTSYSLSYVVVNIVDKTIILKYLGTMEFIIIGTYIKPLKVLIPDIIVIKYNALSGKWIPSIDIGFKLIMGETREYSYQA